MVCPFHQFHDLASIWAQSAPTLVPRADLIVTVRFPAGTFEKLQDHFRHDRAIMSFSRLLHHATSDAHLHVGSALSQADILEACVLTLDQVQAISAAPSDSDAAVLHLMGKTVSCFKWDKPVDGVGGARASDLECTLMSSLEKANGAIRDARKVLEWSRFDPVQDV